MWEAIYYWILWRTCHSAYVTWSHVPARLSHFCCRTHFVRRDHVTYASSALQTLSVSCLQKNTLLMSAATLKPVQLECYLPRLPGAKSSHKITWQDDTRVCCLTWREDSVTRPYELLASSQRSTQQIPKFQRHVCVMPRVTCCHPSLFDQIRFQDSKTPSKSENTWIIDRLSKKTMF